MALGHLDRQRVRAHPSLAEARPSGCRSRPKPSRFASYTRRPVRSVRFARAADAIVCKLRIAFSAAPRAALFLCFCLPRSEAMPLVQVIGKVEPRSVAAARLKRVPADQVVERLLRGCVAAEILVLEPRATARSPDRSILNVPAIDS